MKKSFVLDLIVALCWTIANPVEKIWKRQDNMKTVTDYYNLIDVV